MTNYIVNHHAYRGGYIEWTQSTYRTDLRLARSVYRAQEKLAHIDKKDGEHFVSPPFFLYLLRSSNIILKKLLKIFNLVLTINNLSCIIMISVIITNFERRIDGT